MNPSFSLNFLPGFKVHNHISDEMEVGFTQYGPLLGVSGTVLAPYKVIFVNRMAIEIKNSLARNSKKFEWFAFRPHGFVLQKFAELDYKMPSKFMVPPGNGHPYDVLFCDRQLYVSLKPIFRDIKKAWLQKQLQAKASSYQGNDAALFQDFLKIPNVEEQREKLAKLVYWQPGAYRLSFQVQTEKPRRTYATKRKFVISEEHALLLKKATDLVVKHLCGQRDVLFESITTPLR